MPGGAGAEPQRSADDAEGASTTTGPRYDYRGPEQSESATDSNVILNQQTSRYYQQSQRRERR